MTGLHVPEEVLIHIFSYLQPSLPVPSQSLSVTDRIYPSTRENRPLYSTLAAICRSSKTFYRLVVPVLYNTIEFCGPGHWLEGEPVAASVNVKPLLRTLIGNAWLAREIKNLGIERFQTVPAESDDLELVRLRREWLVWNDGRWIWPEAPPHAQKVLVRNKFDGKAQRQCALAIQSLNLSTPLEGLLTQAIAVGFEDGEMAVMLALCPCIERLELGVPKGLSSLRRTLFMTVADELTAKLPERTGADQSSFLSRLRELVCRCNDSLGKQNMFHLANIEPLLSAPRLRSLQVYGMQATERNRDGRLSRRHTHLQNLTINQSVVDSHGLENILNAFPSLWKLAFTAYATGRSDVDFNAVAQKICVHGRNVETLTFSPRVAEAIVTFKWTPKLKHLAAPWTALQDEAVYINEAEVDWFKQPGDNPWLQVVLPKSLETLDVLESDVRYARSTFARLFWRSRDWSHMDHRLLWPLMADSRFERLKRIRLERDVGFRVDLSAGWKESREGKWVVLERLPQE